MGRQPKNNQKIWDAVRMIAAAKGHPFSAAHVAHYTKIPYNSVKCYLIGLTRAGYLRAQVRNDKPTQYFLERDVGVDAPRVLRDGTETTNGRVNEQMWRTMRILHDFTARELAVSASTEDTQVSISSATTYITHLRATGYLRIVERTKKGPKGTSARYALTRYRNTGPKPPHACNDGTVYDPNTDRIMEVTAR